MSNELVLKDSIYSFINKIGVTNMEQIRMMYGQTHDSETIKWCVKQLLIESLIDRDKETGNILRRGSVDPDDFQQKQSTVAAWLIAAMGDDAVREFFPADYPCQFIVITEENAVYDITVFTPATQEALSVVVPIRRKQLLPEGIEDTIIHVALLSDESVAEDIKNLPFDSYCILDEKNNPQYYDWSE